MPAMWFALTLVSATGLLVAKSASGMLQMALATFVFGVLFGRSAIKWVQEAR